MNKLVGIWQSDGTLDSSFAFEGYHTIDVIPWLISCIKKCVLKQLLRGSHNFNSNRPVIMGLLAVKCVLLR